MALDHIHIWTSNIHYHYTLSSGSGSEILRKQNQTGDRIGKAIRDQKERFCRLEQS